LDPVFWTLESQKQKLAHRDRKMHFHDTVKGTPFRATQADLIKHLISSLSHVNVPVDPFTHLGVTVTQGLILKNS